MKRFYSFVAMSMSLLAAMAQTSTVDIPLTFCIDVDDPSLIYVQDSNYQSVELVKGENVFTTVYHKTTYSDGSSYGYSEGLYLYVYSNKSTEYNIYSCDYQVGGETYPYNSVSYPTTSVYLSLEESMDGCIFHPLVEAIESHRTASATVNIEGDASKAMIRFSNGYSPDLVDGVNIIKFDPANESTWTIGARNYGEYLGGVSVNGTAVNEVYGYYYVNVVNGDVIDINTQASTEDVTVSFSFTNVGTEDAVEGVYRFVNYSREPISNWIEGFTAEMRDQIIVVLDVENYKINQLTVNGEPQYVSVYNPEVYITLTANSVITVDAERYATYSVNLNLTDPYQVDIILAQSEYSGGTPLTNLQAGNQTIEVSQMVSYMIVNPVNGCVITHVSYTPAGYSESYEVTAGYSGYVIPLSDGVQIDIISQKLERNSQATLWINNIDNVYTLYLQYADGSYVFNTYGEVAPVTGNQTFYFNEETDNPFYLYFAPTNGGYDPEIQGYVQVNGVTVEPKYQDSTSYELYLKNGDEIRVYANEQQTTGVESVAVEAEGARSGIYDLSGRRLPSQSKLNPGIYVINGKKVLVK